VVIATLTALGCTRRAEAVQEPPVPIPAETAVERVGPVSIAIACAWPGAGAAEIAHAIARPLEQAVHDLPGIARRVARSERGGMSLELFLRPGVDVASTLQELRERTRRVVLPDDASEIAIRRRSTEDRVLAVALESSTLTASHLRELAETQMRRTIDALAGVRSVDVRGGTRARVDVSVDASRLAATGLTLTDVEAGLRLLSAGSTLVGSPRIDLANLGDHVLRAQGPLRLSDVATVRVVEGEPGSQDPVTMRVRISPETYDETRPALVAAVGRVLKTSSAGVEATYAEPARSVSVGPFRVYLDPKFGAPSTLDGVPGTSSWARVESAPEVEIVLDRTRAAALGVPVVELSLAIRAATDGVPCGRVVLADGDGSRTLEMRLRLLGKSGSDSTDPMNASLPSADGRLIPLSDVARRQVNAGAGDEALYTVDGSPVVAFEGRLAPGAQLEAVDAELRKRFGDGVMRVPLDPD
jgi:multidrug efflux pump subunit AcrB